MPPILNNVSRGWSPFVSSFNVRNIDKIFSGAHNSPGSSFNYNSSHPLTFTAQSASGPGTLLATTGDG